MIDHDRIQGLVGAFKTITDSMLRDPRVDGIIAAVESGAREHEILVSLFTNLVSQNKQLLSHVKAPGSPRREKRPRLEQIRALVAGTAHLHECGGNRKCTCIAQVRSVLEPRENEYDDDEEEEEFEDEPIVQEPIIHDADCPPGVKGKCACRLRVELARHSKSPRVTPVMRKNTFSNWDIVMALGNIQRWARRNKFDRQDPLIRRILSVRFELVRTEPSFSVMLDEIPVAPGISCSACGGVLQDTGIKAASCSKCLFHPVCAVAICVHFGRNDFDRCFGKLNGPEACST